MLLNNAITAVVIINLVVLASGFRLEGKRGLEQDEDGKLISASVVSFYD